MTNNYNRKKKDEIGLSIVHQSNKELKYFKL